MSLEAGVTLTRRQFAFAPAAGLAAVSLIARAQSGEWVCPMDPDIQRDAPGVCPRCGMTLSRRSVDPVSFDLSLHSEPDPIRANQSADLTIRITDPRTHEAVTRFDTVHEKLFHLFAVRQDLQWFLHDHPVLSPGGAFRLRAIFPSPGMYVIFSDVVPSGATPQWIPRFLFTADATLPATRAASIAPNIEPQNDRDVVVSVEIEPERLWAGRKSILRFTVQPGDGLAPWLGAPAHAFWVSNDLNDAAHTHPAVPGSMEFHVFFPRAATYRFWLQFMRRGTVHTVHFDVPVYS